MSSEPTAKRKREQRPCDMCRRRKRRCDGGERCSNCAKNNDVCMRENSSLRRSSYVEGLEMRLKTVESALQNTNTTALQAPASDAADPAKAWEPSALAGAGMLALMTASIRSLNTVPPPHSKDLGFEDVADSFRSLSLDSPDPGFQGGSSVAMLVKVAVDLRSGHSEPDAPPARTFSALKPWVVKPWEISPPPRTYVFPDNDLLLSLVSLYFVNVNAFLPLLHRPTFEKGVNEGLYLFDDGFAATLLLVCALGSRFSDDPRVHLEHVHSCGTAGWKWYDQVILAGNPLCGEPTLYDLQCYCLAVQFLERTSSTRACWTLVGIGIRLGQDIGAHRHKLHAAKITIEGELERRAFWHLHLFDAQYSAALGRSFVIQDNESDLQYPIACDDEYWERNSNGYTFYQPRNKPSLVEYFNCLLTLNRILSLTLKVLYSLNRCKVKLGLANGSWEEQIVMELESSLNTWFNAIPDHLRWNPACADDIFFDQSATLYCGYYLCQIIIHRPFIPAIRRSSPTRLPSLAICNSAARSCSRVAEIHQQRRPNNPLLFGQTAVFTAGIVLLLNMWSENRSGKMKGNTDQGLSDVRRCLDVLKAQQEQCPSSIPLVHTLQALLSVDHNKSAGSYPDSGISEPSSFTQPHMPEFEFGSLFAPASGAVRDNTASHGDIPSEMPLTNSHIPSTDFFGDPTGVYPDLICADEDRFGDSNYQNSEMTDVLYDNAIAIWSSAPGGFNASDWEMYVNSIGEIL